MDPLSGLPHFCHLQVFWEMLFNKLELAGNSALSQSFLRAWLSTRCVQGAQLHSFHDLTLPRAQEFWVQCIILVCTPAPLQCQLAKKIKESCSHAYPHIQYSSCCRKKGFSVPGSFCGKAADTAALLQCVLACHSLAKQKKNMHRSHSDMIDCSDLPLWVLLHFSFLFVWVLFYGFGFFSHSLLFLAVAASWPTDLVFLLAQRL